jgi:hypothetical protein
MGVPTSEVGYTSATTGRGDNEVHKGHVVALGIREKNVCPCFCVAMSTVIKKNQLLTFNYVLIL